MMFATSDFFIKTDKLLHLKIQCSEIEINIHKNVQSVKAQVFHLVSKVFSC